MRGSRRAALTLVVMLLAACSATEGFWLDARGPAGPAELERARAQLQTRLDVLRPDAEVRIQGGRLFVGMPQAEATARFVERLVATGRTEVLAVPADLPAPEEGARVALPPFITADELIRAEPVDVEGADAIGIDLGPAAAGRLSEWTRANIGGSLVLAVDGVAVSVPMIREPIDGPGIQFSGGSGDGHALSWVAAAIESGPLEIDLTGSVAGG